jgi:tRNA-2-methylthio-N6-dimethylallyladenosine synthase
MFAYSMRERTHAYYKMTDDVPEDVKLRRLQQVVCCRCPAVVAKRSVMGIGTTKCQVIDVFKAGSRYRHELEVGRRHLVLLDGRTKKTADGKIELLGRTHNNKRVLFPGWP